jgi:probable F420-dependent oxidoreductase
MRIGLASSVFWVPFCTAEVLETLGVEAEATGVSTIWSGEHVLWFATFDPSSGATEPHHGLLEPIAALSFLAAATSRIRLATGILIAAQRNPVYMAQQTASLDWLSNGRLVVGVGVGWQRAEFAALQYPFERRGQRLDEYVEVMKRLWCDDVASFDGEHYTLQPSSMFPRPVSQPYPPIHYGGKGDSILRRVARVGQGWHATMMEVEDLTTRFMILDNLLEQHDRVPGDIDTSMLYTGSDALREAIPRYAETGLDELVVRIDASDVDAVRRSLAELQPAIELAAACGGPPSFRAVGQ